MAQDRSLSRWHFMKRSAHPRQPRRAPATTLSAVHQCDRRPRDGTADRRIKHGPAGLGWQHEAASPQQYGFSRGGRLGVLTVLRKHSKLGTGLRRHSSSMPRMATTSDRAIRSRSRHVRDRRDRERHRTPVTWPGPWAIRLTQDTCTAFLGRVAECRRPSAGRMLGAPSTPLREAS
jgi:hypothetical protein